MSRECRRFNRLVEWLPKRPKERVEKDFRNKELLTGVKRHTWDAKVRIFQTRKKRKGSVVIGTPPCD